MSVIPITAGQAVYTPYTTQQQNEKSADPSSTNRAVTSDTVHISDEAKQLSQSTPTVEPGSTPFDPKNPPLEAFAIPTWAAQYSPPVNDLSSGLNYDGFAADRFRQQYRNELQEYSGIRHSAYKKAMETNGLTGEFAYYQKVTLDQTVSSEKVHQDFRENLANSPRAIELMKVLGIDDAVINGLSINSPIVKGGQTMTTITSPQTVTYTQHSLETMQRKHVSSEDQDSFKNILISAAAANGSEKPKTFLNSLSDAELRLLSRVHGQGNASIDTDALSFEGAYNLLRAPGEAKDLNNDAALSVGKSDRISFPPPNSPQELKDAWATATAGLDWGEKATLELQFLNFNGLRNMVCEKHGDQIRVLEVRMPGDPGYVNVFSEADFSYQEATNKLLVSNELSKSLNSSEEYEKMKRNLNAFMTQLIEHGVA